MFINSFLSTRLFLPVLLSTLLIMTHLFVVMGIPLPPANNGKSKVAARTYGIVSSGVVLITSNFCSQDLDHDRYDSSTTAYGPSSETEQDDVYLLPIINEENDSHQTPPYPPPRHTKGAVISEDRLFILRIQEKAEGVEGLGPVLYYSDTQGFRAFINESSHFKLNVNWPWDLEEVTSPRETVLQLKTVAVFAFQSGKPDVEERRKAAVDHLRKLMFQAEHHFVWVAIQEFSTYSQKRFPLLHRDREWEKGLKLLVKKDRLRWRDGEYKKLLKKYVEDAERKVKAQELNDPEEDEIWWKLEKLIWNNCMQGHGMRPNIAGLARKGRECLSLPIRVRIQRW
ncbi:hypothetical protein EV360DRAFT_76172 [Lentinula raphanica]|nr:hypothetical protein EV360DRAFT_76172 [Lentinula raphanica]